MYCANRLLEEKLSQSNLLFVCSAHRDDVGAEFLQVTPQQLHVSGV